MRRRQVSTRFARHVQSKASQKTKVRALVSLLGFAGGAVQTVTIASADDTQRANYFDTDVKPFSHIDQIELDIALYQNGASVSLDGFVDWCIWKDMGHNVASMDPTATTIAMVPFIFRIGRAQVPMLSSAGLPNIYHLRGALKLPPRFRLMNPGDRINLTFKGLAGAGLSYSANGQITYMFKV